MEREYLRVANGAQRLYTLPNFLHTRQEDEYTADFFGGGYDVFHQGCDELHNENDVNEAYETGRDKCTP